MKLFLINYKLLKYICLNIQHKLDKMDSINNKIDLYLIIS